MPQFRPILLAACVCLPFITACGQTDTATEPSGPTFVVTLDPALQVAPQSGRVLVYLIGPDTEIDPDAEPGQAPFYEDPQPVYGVDVEGFGPGDTVRLDDNSATGFPGPMAGLDPGVYRVQAVFDWQRRFGSWQREAGNLHSQVARVSIDAAGRTEVAVTLDTTVVEAEPPGVEGVTYVAVRSELLSAFRGEEVVLHAGVVAPLGHDAEASYPALYIISGFGGNHLMAGGIGRRQRTLGPGTPEHTLASSVFRIVIDADGPHGHTLLADSANNGPVGRAVVEELIPALEARFNLIARPEARLVNGHSSGGWTTLWLATEYPETFGAAWASAPDPVDFHAFQKINIYEDESMYFRRNAADEREPIPSYTSDGVVLMTIGQEIGVENAIGPRNTSGQQWHSWMAVFAPRGADGRPADLYDPVTGDIDHAVAERFRAYDITERLRRDPGRYGPLFHDRIRLVIGDRDSYDLHHAVYRLRDTLGEVWPRVTMEVTPGSITIVPGADHGGVYDSEAMRDWPQDMVTHLRRAGLPVRGD